MNPTFHPQSVFPLANIPPSHIPDTETHQWGPHPSSVFRTHSALHGPLISHWGTRFCICTFLPKSFFIYCINIFISSHYITLFCHHLWRLSSLFWLNETHVTLGWSITYRPYPEYPIVTYLYPLNLFTLSRLWHNLSPVLWSP
jgi:hypothetical protein